MDERTVSHIRDRKMPHPRLAATPRRFALRIGRRQREAKERELKAERSALTVVAREVPPFGSVLRMARVVAWEFERPRSERALVASQVLRGHSSGHVCRRCESGLLRLARACRNGQEKGENCDAAHASFLPQPRGNARAAHAPRRIDPGQPGRDHSEREA